MLAANLLQKTAKTASTIPERDRVRRAGVRNLDAELSCAG
jgi:hypothetical protein